MARFLRNNDDDVLEGNRYYWKWKITKPLLESVMMVKKIKLHSTTWRHFTMLDGGFLHTSIEHVGNSNYAYSKPHFEIRVGILGDNLNEVTAIATDVDSDSELISRSQLDSILKTNKFLHLFVEIEKKDETGQKIKNRRQWIQADFKELLLSGRKSDVTIEVKNKKFNCHRCILGTRSPLFAAMFDHDMKAKASRVVTIEDVEPAVFQEFLLYLYSGNDNLLTWENVADLYKLADKYGLEDLKIACTNDIKENIDQESFLEFFKMTRLHHDSTLIEIVTRFFIKYPDQIVRRENWVAYLSEYPMEGNKLLTRVQTIINKWNNKCNTVINL